ncbi:MAG: MATE family efflux transporter [Phycisphaerae bacterium]|nr:MATE family efflux transporter [Phycisphaerae bacterium]
MNTPARSADRAATAAVPRSALGEFMALAWPTVLTMLSYTLMQFVDAIMVAQVGPDEVAAQGNGGVWGFVPIAFLFGALTVVNTFVSQSLGAGRPHDVARYGWAGMWFGVGSWLVVLVPFGFILPWMFSVMGHTERVTELETSYAQVLVFGGVVTLVGKGLSNFFFGIHRPGVITVAAISGNVANIALNYVLIYGEAGLPSLGLPGVPGVPALGLTGAAIATVLGTAVETLIPAALFLGRRMNAAYGVRAAWRPDLRAMIDLMRVGAPAGLQTGSEIFTWAIFMAVLMGRFGTEALTASWITLRYMHLAFMPAVGFSVATTSMVGRYIGAGKPDVARARVGIALKVSMLYMGLCGAAMFVFREPMLAFFAYGANTPTETAERIVALGGSIMIAAAIFQTFDAVGIVLIGALRGAGDTLWPSMVTIALSWSLIIGLGVTLVTLAPGLGPLAPWIAAAVYIAAFGAAMAWRWRSGAWRSITILRGVKAEAALAAPPEMGIPADTDPHP